MTSGIKAQASVFNVWGRPCLCVEASGSMKGGGRGHLGHLLLSCTTHLSICVRCCPSVHSNTSRKRHSLMLRVNAHIYCRHVLPVRVFFILHLFSAEEHHLALASVLGWRKVSSFIIEGNYSICKAWWWEREETREGGTPLEARIKKNVSRETEK